MGFLIGILTTVCFLTMLYLISVAFFSLFDIKGTIRFAKAYKKLKSSSVADWRLDGSMTSIRLFDGTRETVHQSISVVLDPYTKLELRAGKVSLHRIVSRYYRVIVEHPVDGEKCHDRDFDRFFTLKGWYVCFIARYVEKRICSVIAAKSL